MAGVAAQTAIELNTTLGTLAGLTLKAWFRPEELV